MATYDYLCRSCDRIVEVRATVAEKVAGLTPTCPTCTGADLRRVFSPIVSAGARSGLPQFPAGGGGGGGGGCCGGGCGCG
jgi:putative FmdB family regulatory protein